MFAGDVDFIGLDLGGPRRRTCRSLKLFHPYNIYSMKDCSLNMKIKEVVGSLSKARLSSFLTVLPYHSLKLE